jgi:hypothetical protein
MKSRQWLTRSALAACCGALLFAIHAAAQQPLGQRFDQPTLVPRVVQERTPDGKVVTRQVLEARSAGASPFANDPEVQQMLQLEMALAADARKLADTANFGDSEGERDDAKDKLREKLVEIFDLQQKRRAHEIAKIEERLTRLKETMTKRDAAKDSIVDRRLDVLTGGIDELGWEETGSQGIPGGDGFNPYRPTLPPPVQPMQPNTSGTFPSAAPLITGPGPGVTVAPAGGITLPGPPTLSNPDATLPAPVSPRQPATRTPRATDPAPAAAAPAVDPLGGQRDPFGTP